ncbi:sialidase family protein [Prosthecobacter sp. SYSU 5D2]|uniref:sialidase family protein n=1 Tax=Prosthecobacter sp. SYSU 5D2 TaxID=3134134 RepID=UPI0031FE8DFD
MNCGPIIALVCFTASLLGEVPVLEKTALWTSGQDGYHTYRIPSLLVTGKGSVLAFCEGRKTGSGDHGDVDLIMKRSTDGGRTWSPHFIVHEEGREAKITIGNPCPVVDAETGTIWLPFNRDNKAVFITSSSDDGLTWSTPLDISASTMKPDWTWVATGPGIGIQLKNGPHIGRLVIPSDHKRQTPSGEAEMNSHMMFSDDGGQTWQISSPIQAGGNECQVIERADGSLLVNTRMQGDFKGHRGIATSQDGGLTWTDIRQEPQLPCPRCQGSLLDAGVGTLIFSNPDPGASLAGKEKGPRINLTVRLSRDEGASWPVARLLHEGPAAYSSLARLPDGTVFCLYECGEKTFRETLTLARFDLNWLTSEP